MNDVCQRPGKLVPRVAIQWWWMIVIKDLALIIFAFIISAPILLSLVSLPDLNWSDLGLSEGTLNLLARNESYPQEPVCPTPEMLTRCGTNFLSRSAFGSVGITTVNCCEWLKSRHSKGHRLLLSYTHSPGRMYPMPMALKITYYPSLWNL